MEKEQHKKSKFYTRKERELLCSCTNVSGHKIVYANVKAWCCTNYAISTILVAFYSQPGESAVVQIHFLFRTNYTRSKHLHCIKMANGKCIIRD